MKDWLCNRRYSPIGVDIGSRSVKLVQFDGDRAEVTEAASCDRASDVGEDQAARDDRIVETLRRAQQGRNFRGRDAVMCVGAGNLFVQNIRVPQLAGEELRKTVCAEAASRLPFASDEAEIRYLEAADVRQGEVVKREVIVMACRRAVIDRIISWSERAGLVPVAIEVEPIALVRSYAKQFRRDDDQQRRIMFINVGAATTQIVIARGGQAMFVKYIDLGGRHFDQAVAGNLGLSLADAAALRRHHGDRRADRRDAEVEQSVMESVRGVRDRLANELSLCMRYHSVAFRGQPLTQMVLSGGEADDALAEWLGQRLDLPCAAGDPFRACTKAPKVPRAGQWDVAAGLALREAT